MGTIYAVMSRSDVRGLLIRHTDTHVTDELVSAWLSGLSGYGLAECHAAMTALGTAARHTTPSEIAGRCDAARDRAARPGPPQPATDTPANVPAQRQPGSEDRRDYYRQAGMRGIRTAYEVMGWTRNPDHDLARSVPCPFCRAKTWAVCSPLSRNRAGVQEKRDPHTRMHPSRLERARAQLARQATATQTPKENP